VNPHGTSVSVDTVIPLIMKDLSRICDGHRAVGVHRIAELHCCCPCGDAPVVPWQDDTLALPAVMWTSSGHSLSSLPVCGLQKLTLLRSGFMGRHVSPSRELCGNLGLPQSNLNLKAASKGKMHSGPFALERGASSAGSTRMSRVPIEHTRKSFIFSSQPAC
jgi:hypothetical protein